jgi:beta-mannosidase
MYGGPEVEVGELLHYEGPNELVVEVRPGNYYSETYFNPFDTSQKVIIPWGIAGGFGGITGGGRWLIVRDGVPLLDLGRVGIEEFFPAGIWGKVRLEILPRVHLERPFLVTKEATQSEARLSLSVEVLANTRIPDFKLHAWDSLSLFDYFRNAWTSKLIEGQSTLQVELIDPASSHTVFDRSIPLKVYEGRNWVEQELTISSPKIWWPNGMGDPNLYQVRLSLIREGKLVDKLEFDYGIRTIRTIRTGGTRTDGPIGSLWSMAVRSL